MPSAAPASAQVGQETGQTQHAPSSVVFSTAPGSYGGLAIGEMRGGGNVRSGPSITSARLKSWGAGRRVLLYEGVTDASGGLWYRVSEAPEQPMYVHSSLVRYVAPVKFEAGKYRGRWVNINLSQQVVTAYQDGTPLRVTLASTGTKKHPTEVG
ncbi:MAG TPA: L,D-transpeptidase, partial [Chloroflexia bacterium]